MAAQSIMLLALAASGVRAVALPFMDNSPLVKRSCNNGGGNINNGDGLVPICTTYCENSSKQITGPPQNVTAHVTCDTTTCAPGVSQTYTSTQSFSISIGGDASAGDDTIKGGASVGASWSWSTSQATSQTYTFTLSTGDAGNVVFKPYYQQSCGDMKYFLLDSSDDGFSNSCDPTPYAEDTNACGQTPIMNGNFADGDFSFCYTDGPKKGQGC